MGLLEEYFRKLQEDATLGSPEGNMGTPKNMTGQRLPQVVESAHPVGALLNAIGGYNTPSQTPMSQQPTSNKIGYTMGSIIRELGLKMAATNPGQIEAQQGIEQQRNELGLKTKAAELGVAPEEIAGMLSAPEDPILASIAKAVKPGATDLVYRRADTGEEIAPDMAKKAIENGDRNFNVFKRISTKAGEKETILNKVPDLTQEEKQYVVASQRIVKSTDGILNKFKDIYTKKGNSFWRQVQVEKLPYLMVRDQDLQYIKSSLLKLKGDIPFLRGGKQLTPMEAKRVDVLLNPFGKNEKTYRKDLEQFKTEFTSGAEIMIGGVSALNKPQAKNYVRTGTNKKGQRVGQLEDGTIEVINGK